MTAFYRHIFADDKIVTWIRDRAINYINNVSSITNIRKNNGKAKYKGQLPGGMCLFIVN